jgi:hypothetical protein
MGPTYYPLGRVEEMSEGDHMAMDAYDEEIEYDPAAIEQQAAFERLDHIDAPAGVWNSTSGPIPMKLMTDAHLKNALRWLDRYNLLGTDKAAEIRDEQERRVRRARSARKARKADGGKPPLMKKRPVT